MPQSELQWIEDGCRWGVMAVESFFGRLFAPSVQPRVTSPRPQRGGSYVQNNTYVQNNVNITNYTNVFVGVKRKRRSRRYLGD